MNYKEHTKQRFNEKFIPLFKNKKKNNFWKNKINQNWSELTNEDYHNLCKISLNEPLYKELSKNRVIIKYNNTFMWCVLTKKSKIVKTIYPIDKSDFKKYLNNE